MSNVYFENVEQIGSLYMEHIFFEFENEPILFVCRDDADKLYLCLCSEIRAGQRWIVARTDIETLSLLIDKKMDILSAFLKVSNVVIIDMDLGGNEKSRVVERDAIDKLDLPKEGTYIRCDKTKAYNYLWSKEFAKMYHRLRDAMRVDDMVDEMVKTYSVSINNMVNALSTEINKSFNLLVEEQVKKLNVSIQKAWQVEQTYHIQIKKENLKHGDSIEIIDEYADAA